MKFPHCEGVEEMLQAIGQGSNVLDAQFIDSYEIFGNADYISQYNSVDGDGQCIEENVVGIISKQSNLMQNQENQCQAQGSQRHTQSLTNHHFQMYQQCSIQGKKLIKKCPKNSVYWNILKCCVNIMDFPCKSNCIVPKNKCV